MKTMIFLFWVMLIVLTCAFSTTGQNKQKAELIVETGHGNVWSAAFSPNGKLLATGSAEDTISLRDILTGRELKTLSANTDSAYSVSFSPDSQILASAGMLDGVVELWEVATGQKITTLKHSNSTNRRTERTPYSTIKFSPDGKMLVSFGDKISAWNVTTGQEINFNNLINKANDLVFSHNQPLLALVTGKTVTVWNLENGKLLFTLVGHSEDVLSIVFSNDNKTIISTSQDKTVRLWDSSTGQEAKSFKGHTHFTLSAAISSDGKLLASGSADKTVKIWDIKTGQEIHTLYGHSDYDYVDSVIFSLDNKTIISQGRQSIKLWDIVNGKEIKTLEKSADMNGLMKLAVSFDNNLVSTTGTDNRVNVWNIKTGRQLYNLTGHKKFVKDLVFSPVGNLLASVGSDDIVKLWNFDAGIARTFGKYTNPIVGIVCSPKGKAFASGGWDGTIQLWNIASGSQTLNTLINGYRVGDMTFSPDGKTFVASSEDGSIRIWEAANGNELKSLKGHKDAVFEIKFSPDGKFLASAGIVDYSIKLWDTTTWQELYTLAGHSDLISLAFSPDGKLLASASAKTIKLWDVTTGQELNTFSTQYDVSNSSLIFSPNGQTLAFQGKSDDKKIIPLLDIATGRELQTLPAHTDAQKIAFSSNGQIIAAGNYFSTIELWDVGSGEKIKSFDGNNLKASREIFNIVPEFYLSSDRKPIMPDGKVQVDGGGNDSLNLIEVETGKILLRLFPLNRDNWIVTTSEGRFDTNKSLDKVEGLHWIVNDEILRPLPLDIFMRQYYEPGLLQRVLNGEPFKPIPSIADINRVQPKVTIKNIKPAANAADLVDVTIEVESVTDEVSTSATDRTKQKRLASGAYDLRLFRDSQLVGVSAPPDKLAAFIDDAPRLINETKTLGKLLDTPEDRAWREVNDIFKLKSENIKLISSEKAEYTFRNIKLPKDGRKAVEFTAYAFNADKVKSTTTEPFKFTVPTAIANAPKKGRAFLISIGVNASENPAYDLRYAANDARQMQKIIGVRLQADVDKYAEVIQIPLISDYGKDKKVAQNSARKAIIKGVFSLLAGHEKEVPVDILNQIPDRGKIRQIEPEDTLIITYAGHGYADDAGIFYLLPYEIGADTKQLTADKLGNMISSDELSLWMQDITAAEMIMVIDACHSSAAVQGDGFKPGPMGSRGLGQLAYDKDMKILSATQADNVALELDRLEQGLLSYALLQDGIKAGLADSQPKDKQLSSTEWLTYAEKRVPQLYREVKDGKRSVIINGRNAKAGRSRAELVGLDGKQKSRLNLQQPSLFDFKRRKSERTLLTLP